jgi:hypothetical protein
VTRGFIDGAQQELLVAVQELDSRPIADDRGCGPAGTPAADGAPAQGAGRVVEIGGHTGQLQRHRLIPRRFQQRQLGQDPVGRVAVQLASQCQQPPLDQAFGQPVRLRVRDQRPTGRGWRSLGKIHFWTLFIGFHTTFLVQRWLGDEGMPHRYVDYRRPTGSPR